MWDKIIETFRKFFGKKPEPKRTALVQDFKKIASIGSILVIPAVLLVGYVGSTKHYNAKKSSSSQQIKYIESDVTLTKAKLDNQADAQSHDLVNKKFGKILHLVPEPYRRWSIKPQYYVTVDKLRPWGDYVKKYEDNPGRYLKEKYEHFGITASTKIRYKSQKLYNNSDVKSITSGNKMTSDKAGEYHSQTTYRYYYEEPKKIEPVKPYLISPEGRALMTEHNNLVIDLEKVRVELERWRYEIEGTRLLLYEFKKYRNDYMLQKIEKREETTIELLEKKEKMYAARIEEIENSLEFQKGTREIHTLHKNRLKRYLEVHQKMSPKKGES